MASVACTPGVTEPTLVLVPRTKYRHASAAPLAGLITLRPLHSISLQFRRLHFRSIRSDGRKLPRPSKTAVRPKIPEAAMLRISAKTGNMAARLRPAKTSAIRREAPPIAEDVAKAVRSAISAPPPLRKLHCGGQKQPNSLIKPDWSDTTTAGCAPASSHCPCSQWWPSARSYALPSWSQRNGVRAGATTPGNATRRNCCWLCGGVGMREQPTLRFSLRCEAGRRLCSRDRTQHILCVWSFMLRFHINSFRADNSPRAGPFGTEFMSHNMALCAIPPLHCHADCESAPRIRAGSQRASWRASLMPTPPRREIF